MRELLCSLNNCSFGYSKNKIFENLFFNINDGDKIALVGRWSWQNYSYGHFVKKKDY